MGAEKPERAVGTFVGNGVIRITAALCPVVPILGNGMDKQIKKKKWTVKRISTYGGIALFTVFVGYQFIFADRRSKLKIDREKITISNVQRGVFQEFIPQTGT